VPPQFRLRLDHLDDLSAERLEQPEFRRGRMAIEPQGRLDDRHRRQFALGDIAIELFDVLQVRRAAPGWS